MLEILDRLPLANPFKRQTSPGAAPGMLVARPDAPAPTITVMRYNHEKFMEDELVDLNLLAVSTGADSVTCEPKC